ncbi:hypothetical protein [Aliiroseovarius sp. 2305UL8-7]|uniref:hypothetical protein n=1 Tax=Aliiroseovarius conchicola TaxID=3121637 RepID=UPI00352935E9
MTKKTEKASNTARVAYDMARALWFEETDSHPKLSDWQFFELVKLCSISLAGNSPYSDTWEEAIGKITSS